MGSDFFQNPPGPTYTDRLENRITRARIELQEVLKNERLTEFAALHVWRALLILEGKIA